MKEFKPKLTREQCLFAVSRLTLILAAHCILGDVELDIHPIER